MEVTQLDNKYKKRFGLFKPYFVGSLACNLYEIQELNYREVFNGS